MKFLIIFFLAIISAANSENSGRFDKGKKAAVGQFPYVVHLEFDKMWICTGSLISSTWVLTAAAFTDGSSSVEVKLGAVDVDKPDISFFVLKDKFVQHEDYISTIGKNDIALIGIPSVEYTKNIENIYLPRSAQSYLQYINESVVTAGYGQNGLLYAEMRVISNEVCSKRYDDVTPNKICAISEDSNSLCPGDTGGPLVLRDSKFIIGIFSFGKKNCEKKIPSGFTRVTSYLDWIANNTALQ